ncbi:MAG TPA: hypothetical protein IAA06_15355 [Candidatus Blautia faecavium]|uniref:Uncharacterized protein n=1 Tax=Candidatus Blautia faecavium TaxID=2838487 RepID=A0A9D2RX91_9FIRM|nr:hypothetical protein [Candidatus Blautia faecavium]
MADTEKKEQNKTEYLQEIAQELLDDETWELPKDARFFLLPGFEWDMLYL